MGRTPRVDIGNEVYHIVNRANARRTLFTSHAEYQHFEHLLKEAVEKFNMRLIAYVIMPNHWHLVLYPRSDGDLSLFMQWLTLTHTQQYHAWKETVGHGHIYQGRYKSFLIERDSYLLAAIKYVERNPVRAKLVTTVESWRWGSGFIRLDGTKKQRSLLSESPIDVPAKYRTWVNTPEKQDDLSALRDSIIKSTPLGTTKWTERMVSRFGLQITLRKPGRPRKHENGT